MWIILSKNLEAKKCQWLLAAPSPGCPGLTGSGCLSAGHCRARDACAASKHHLHETPETSVSQGATAARPKPQLLLQFLLSSPFVRTTPPLGGVHRPQGVGRDVHVYRKLVARWKLVCCTDHGSLSCSHSCQAPSLLLRLPRSDWRPAPPGEHRSTCSRDGAGALPTLLTTGRCCLLLQLPLEEKSL